MYARRDNDEAEKRRPNSPNYPPELIVPFRAWALALASALFSVREVLFVVAN